MSNTMSAMMKMHAGIAHPWLCDVMGHLNSRHYVALFDDAIMIMLARLRDATHGIISNGIGWADARNEIEYRSEVRVGQVVDIYLRISKIGTTSLTADCEMRAIATDAVCARMVATIVHFDSNLRKSVPIDDAVRDRAVHLGFYHPAG